jgi:hypothetical protein
MTYKVIFFGGTGDLAWRKLMPFGMVHCLAKVGFSQQPESATMTRVIDCGWLSDFLSYLGRNLFASRPLLSSPNNYTTYPWISQIHRVIPSFAHGSTVNQQTPSSFISLQRPSYSPKSVSRLVRQA